MQEIIDTYLDADGKVTTDPKKAVEMRRIVREDGRLVKSAVYYNDRFAKKE
jgi:hypothetical protein